MVDKTDSSPKNFMDFTLNEADDPFHLLSCDSVPSCSGIFLINSIRSEVSFYVHDGNPGQHR